MTIDAPPTLTAQEFRELRLRRRLTQQKLAELCGVSIGTIGVIEGGWIPSRPAPRRDRLVTFLLTGEVPS